MAQFFFRALPVITAKDATMNFEQLTFLFNGATGGSAGLGAGEVRIKAEPWKLLSSLGYQNSWEDYEPGRKGEYRKNIFGNVEIRGIIKGGEQSKVAVTLPKEYRPASERSWATLCGPGGVGNASIGFVAIAPTGTVTPATSSVANQGSEPKTFTYLDVISFSPE